MSRCALFESYKKADCIELCVQDPTTHKITDFFSFYSLPSTIIGNAKYPLLEAAYLYYYASDSAFQPDADSSGSLQRRLTVLIGDALVVANNARFDVFNALTLMDNVPVLQDLKVRVPDFPLLQILTIVLVWRRRRFPQLLPVQLENLAISRNERRGHCLSRKRDWSRHVITRLHLVGPGAVILQQYQG